MFSRVPGPRWPQRTSKTTTAALGARPKSILTLPLRAAKVLPQVSRSPDSHPLRRRAARSFTLDRLSGPAALRALPEAAQVAAWRELRVAIEQREATARAEVVT